MKNQNVGLGLLAPALLNPALSAAIGMGLVGFGLYKLMTDDCGTAEDDEDDLENSSLQIRDMASPMDVSEGSPEPVTDSEILGATGGEPYNLVAEKREMIRQAMSELGKRSAASRSQKRNALK